MDGAVDTALAVPVKLRELAYCMPPDGAATPAGVAELAGDGDAAAGGDEGAAATGEAPAAAAEKASEAAGDDGAGAA